MTNSFFTLVGEVLKKAVSLLMAFFFGRAYEKSKQLKKEARDAEKQARKWADAGNESTPDRLRRIAREKDRS